MYPAASYAEYISPRYWPMWLMLGIMWLVVKLPFSWQLAMGKFIGWLLYKLARKRRHIAKTNIALCFPGESQPWRDELTKSTFKSYGMALIETANAWWANMSHFSNRYELIGAEHLHKALEQNKGVLVLGVHLVTIDFAGGLLGLNESIDVIYRRHKNPLFNAAMKRNREKHFARAVDRKDVRGILRRLKQNRPIWYAADQDYGRKHSVFAPLFGIPAASITALNRLAKWYGTPVLMVTHYRHADGKRYTVEFSDVLNNFPSDDDVKDATRVNQLVEQAIMRAPEQYLWLHRRFKTRPEGELRPY